MLLYSKHITMEENQQNVAPSPENLWTPQGAPAGVFVSNGQTPVSDIPAQASVAQPTSQASVLEQQPAASQITSPGVQQPAQPGALEKLFNGLAKFIAKITGQPDPITGESNTSNTAKKTENIVGKVWNVANKAVEKASDAASKATNVVTQATEKIQQVIPPPTASTPQSSPEVVSVEQATSETISVEQKKEEIPTETPAV